MAKRWEAFCDRFGLKVPILLAPMSGVPVPELSIEVAKAGGLGACGVLTMSPEEILAWADAVRGAGPFQLNNWIRDPVPRRNSETEERVRRFLSGWGPEVTAEAGDAVPPDFDAQCEAMLQARPTAVSSVMGVFEPEFVQRLKDLGIAWFANVTTVKEARTAEAAGADVIVAQGSEAGGHRGAFVAEEAERRLVGLFSLVPAVVDAVDLPVVATGGIADGRGVVAALALGASAVQVGTGFLRCPEAGIPQAWADALGQATPEETMVTRTFSGRAGRSLTTTYVLAANGPDAPPPAPYPVQRGLTAVMRAEAARKGDVQRMQAWAGQSAALARTEPAAAVVARLWEEARGITF